MNAYNRCTRIRNIPNIIGYLLKLVHELNKISLKFPNNRFPVYTSLLLSYLARIPRLSSPRGLGARFHRHPPAVRACLRQKAGSVTLMIHRIFISVYNRKAVNALNRESKINHFEPRSEPSVGTLISDG